MSQQDPVNLKSVLMGAMFVWAASIDGVGKFSWTSLCVVERHLGPPNPLWMVGLHQGVLVWVVQIHQGISQWGFRLG